MNLNEILIAELRQEAASTRKILKQVPTEHLDWRPHEKSFTLSRMASHVAELSHFATLALTTDELDMVATPLTRHTCTSNEEIIALFDGRIAEALKALEGITNEQLMETWTLRAGDRVISSSSRLESIRSWMANHQIHHRGQLSVYLRLLDVPIPGMYGPSADDRIAMEKAQATANN
ncbi:MAG: DinB family protein [Sphingobacteriales bacterium]|nr:MAG: DinB family protein [Sphingobacteriales bacterium]